LFNEPALNTLSRDVALSRDGLRSYKIVAEVPLKTRALGSILDEYLPLGQKLDFLNVDVEGSDLAVLSSDDWSKYRPPSYS
jgi:hypothetical protein